jgi:hypothetical protein
VTVVVSDTSIITSLLTVKRAFLLRDLFDFVLIPPAVEKELKRAHDRLPDFIHVSRPESSDSVAEHLRTLDLGEAEAIALAEDVNADLLLIDEKLGRAVAQKAGLRVMGLMGMLVEAKERHLIERVGPVVDELARDAGFRVSGSLRSLILTRAGEA